MVDRSRARASAHSPFFIALIQESILKGMVMFLTSPENVRKRNEESFLLKHLCNPLPSSLMSSMRTRVTRPELAMVKSSTIV